LTIRCPYHQAIRVAVNSLVGNIYDDRDSSQLEGNVRESGRERGERMGEREKERERGERY
jgi:hypothetical protein